MSFDRLLDILGPLAGTLVGGLITYWVTRSVELQKWRREKQDRLAAAKREAIAKALGWLDPMDRSLTTVNLQVSSLLQFDLDDETFMASYPNLISELAKMDLPADLRVLLPTDVYPDGLRILRSFDEVRTEAIRWGQRARLERKPMLGLRECGQKLDDLKQQIESLREKLTQSYSQTFE